MDSKLAFIEDYLRDDLSFSELCRRHKISRPCGYKWVSRYEGSGVDGLHEHSRRPERSPYRCSESLEAEVIAIRKAHPVWGGRKIQKILQRKSLAAVPAPSTITNILRRHGMLGVGMRNGSDNMKRFERSEPNDLWQLDFKGWIGLGNGKRCYPLTALDDRSRFNVVLKACSGEQNKDVRPPLIEAFERYGLPRQILCDHGNPWGKHRRVEDTHWLTRFEVWLLRLGIEVIHGRIRHPQTQGKEERFHRTLKAEVLDQTLCWRTLQHCQEAFNQWQCVYNHQRPHEALDYKTPSEVYSLSQRSYPRCLPEEESFYLETDRILKVKSKGEVTFKNKFFYIGSGFTGHKIALRPLGGEENIYDVFFCWKKLGSINLNKAYKQKGRYHAIT